MGGVFLPILKTPPTFLSDFTFMFSINQERTYATLSDYHVCFLKRRIQLCRAGHFNQIAIDNLLQMLQAARPQQ